MQLSPNMFRLVVCNFKINKKIEPELSPVS